jgi:hypothetical protein
MSGWQALAFDDCCHLVFSTDLSTWTAKATPPPTTLDYWTDMTMAVNDGDYATLFSVDQEYDVDNNANPNQGAVGFATSANYDTQAIFFPVADPTTLVYMGAISGNAAKAYLGTAAGVRVSLDRGATWSNVPGLPAGGYTCVAFSRNASLIYVGGDSATGSGGHVYKSADGASWTELSSGPGDLAAKYLNRLRCSQNGSVVACSSSSVVADDTHAQFHVSYDGGTTWRNTDVYALAGGGTTTPTELHVDFGMPLDGSFILMTLGVIDRPVNTAWRSKAWTSTDGVTWTPLALPAHPPNVIPLACNVSPDGAAFIVAYKSESALGGIPGTAPTDVTFIDISLDGGATWQTTNLAVTGTMLNGFWVSAYILPPSAGGGGGNGGGGGGGTRPPPVWTATGPTLREMTYRRRFIGKSFDPTIVITKLRPGPLRIVELDLWMN